jgi:hypothetical protein
LTGNGIFKTVLKPKNNTNVMTEEIPNAEYHLYSGISKISKTIILAITNPA